MSVRTAPCTWPVDYADCECTALSSLPASGQERVEAMATEYLWRWTGRRFGVCEVTVRPCREDCTEGQSTFNGRGALGFSGAPWRPVLIGGAWFNLGCGVCRDKCGCTTTPSVVLPGPIDSITSIVIDGEVLPEDAYTVQNHKYLIRTDGGRWPTCQDMSSPSASGTGAEGTWEVTYNRGVAVPVGGQIAAGVLACEMAKAVCGEACGLPKRVQTITRQGVTVAVLDSFDDIDTGHTGIWLIDSWVASIAKAPTGARIYSPDVPLRPRRQTWP